MAVCLRCGRESRLISESLNLCVDCIREDFEEVAGHAEEVHREARTPFGLPAKPPKGEHGTLCTLCVNTCRIPSGGVGYCGLPADDRTRAAVTWYYDGLPTNCVGDWVCPGGTGAGYPRFAHRPGPEYGYKNLAVFYCACSLDCLFCQNWTYRERGHRTRKVPPSDLADAVDDRTACICYFGGDPTPQLPHALEASRSALERVGDRILRICWETNGTMRRPLLEEMAELSLRSGGCIKFDLKAWDEGVHKALCGVTNRQTLDNFRGLARCLPRRPDPPFLIASTLLVPGYVDVQEVERIARFIASLDPDIPYSLLAFHPHFAMSDLPTTSRGHAEACRQAALDAGLKRVRIGNVHLLGEAY